MLIKLRNVTFIFFGILLIFELLCTIINLIILEKSVLYDKIDESSDKLIFLNIITSSTGAFINISSLLIIIIFGIHSLYFKVKFKLALYVIL